MNGSDRPARRRLDDAPTEQIAAVSLEREKTRVAFIDIGRTLAALVVFYTHIANQFIQARHGSTAVTDGFTALFEKPLGLSAEGIGQIAIYFFFLVSGFIVTPIALKLGTGRFAVNRFFRIYPMNVFAVALSAVLVTFGLHVLTAGQKPEINAGTLLSNISLANFSIKPFGALVGVAWTLAIEVMFYALLIAVLPLLRRWVWAAIFVELDVVMVLVLLRNQLGEGYGGVASQAAYLIIPIIGQIIWAGWHSKIPGWLAGGFLLAAWGLFVMASNLELDVDYLLRPAPIVFAVLLFLIGLGTESRLRQRDFWTAMSERSYSLYLMHGLVALPIMHALSDAEMPIWLSVLVGVAATFAVVEAAFRLVERPSHNLGRRLSRRPQDTAHPPPKPKAKAKVKPKVKPKAKVRPKPEPPEPDPEPELPAVRIRPRGEPPPRREPPPRPQRREPGTERIRPEPPALRPTAPRQPPARRPNPNGGRPPVNGHPNGTPARRTPGRHAKP